MTIFDYNYQNSFRFCFVIEICQSRWGLKNNSLNLHKKTTNSRILVVVVKWRHCAIVLIRRGRPRAIALGSKPPLVTRIAQTGLGTRLASCTVNMLTHNVSLPAMGELARRVLDIQPLLILSFRYRRMYFFCPSLSRQCNLHQQWWILHLYLQKWIFWGRENLPR